MNVYLNKNNINGNKKNEEDVDNFVCLPYESTIVCFPKITKITINNLSIYLFILFYFILFY